MQTWTCLCSAEDLLVQVQKLLEEKKRKITLNLGYYERIIETREEGKIIVEEQRFYLPYLYYSEKGLVTSIQKLLTTN